MVRYPQGHKEKTREQIVSAAARAFREEGVDAVSSYAATYTLAANVARLDGASQASALVDGWRRLSAGWGLKSSQG